MYSATIYTGEEKEERKYITVDELENYIQSNQ